MKKVILSVAMVATAMFGYAQQQSLQQRYAEFAFRLFDKIEAQNTDKNIVVSPLSAQIALSILLNGAQGESQEEIQKLLNVEGYTVEDINAYNKEIMAKIADNPIPENIQKILDCEGIIPGEGTIPVIKYANSIWTRIALKDEFVGVNESYYDTAVKTVDFTKPETWGEIDAWVYEKTNGRIQKLGLNQNPDAAMILSNVLYFSAPWSQFCKFSTYDTKDLPFYNADGTIVNVPTMNYGEAYYAGIENENGKFARLIFGYDTNKLSMTFFVPNGNTHYTSEQWAFIKDLKNHKPGFLFLPRFDVEYERDMSDICTDLGLQKIFSGDADFSAMSDESFLIDEVKQKARIAIDEEGATAAAATVLNMGSAGREPEEFLDLRFDHPFYFSIEDNSTGTVLFLGKINNLNGPLSQVATGINDIITPNTIPAYTLDGRKADGNSKGIVIKDGKKMIR